MISRILLITPLFYGVESTIKKELEHLGFEVVWIENKCHRFDYHGTHSKLRLIRRVYNFLFSPREKYLRDEFKHLTDLRFDLLFSINADAICTYAFQILKKENPDLISVLYLWDSSNMFNWSEEAKLFDKVYSFDKDDCRKFGYEYKPNFFIRSGNNTDKEPKIDLLFTGKFSYDRICIIDKIKRIFEASGIIFFIRIWTGQRVFFHSGLIYRLLKILRLGTYWSDEYNMRYEAFEGKLKRDYFVNNYLELEEVNQLSASSNVIMDLPYICQSGYSHRLIDALANGRKVITTNKSLSDERFFNPDQVHFMDPLNPEIDTEWIKEPKRYQPDSYFEDCALPEWLKMIVNNVSK